jgi:hypothetical protein
VASAQKPIFIINVKFFKNIFLKENFLKEKEESCGIFFFGNGTLEIN